MKKITFILYLCICWASLSQETIGLVYEDVNSLKSNGYTLFTSISDSRTFLINNCGEVVNEWQSNWGSAPNRQPRMTYLLENGNLLVGSGLDVEIRDWDNNVLWGINYQDVLGYRIHHDIEPLPNGNILLIVKDTYTKTEMFDQGLDTSFTEETVGLERIVEIEPVGSASANIVWEWKLVDHLVQDFDATKPNFGVVADSPQLYDLNYGVGSNPIHANAIDYNADLDQIVISCRNLNEVYIIDHSTTIAEAASHTGGLYGKGGDFLWRWGNPEAYDQGTITEKKLGRQHDVQWITEGPNAGKISVFSNEAYGSNIAASSVHIIDQGDNNGVYALEQGKFLPQDYFWSYDGTIMGTTMFASTRSGVQIMQNGNALINETATGRLSEVDPSGNVVWVYIVPTALNGNLTQFETPSDNGVFRALRYPENYPGFDGVTFNNTGIIENENAISSNCSSLLSVDELSLHKLAVYPNPTKGLVNLEYERPVKEVTIYDIMGKVVMTAFNTNSVNIQELKNGMYLVEVLIENSKKTFKLVKN